METEKLDVAVEEFTTPHPITVDLDATLDELRQKMDQYQIRHIPITQGSRVVGIISDRDLRVAGGLSLTEKVLVRAGDIMIRNPVTVSGGASLEEVALEMAKSKIGSVIVNDANDEMLGIFTVTDALNALIEILRRDGGSR